MIWPLLNVVLGGVALYGICFRGGSKRQGRHVTRPLVRRIGVPMTALTRALMITGCVVCEVTGFSFAAKLILTLYWAWLLDDVYFSDDDDRRRKWEAFKVKLRKCKPVMQRLVQRWKPSIPRVPVPA